VVAGVSQETLTGYARAVVWINDSLVNISQGRESHAFGINDLGQVVGDSWGLAAGTDEAFVWSNGTMQSLGSLEAGESSGACDINNNGDVVGYGYVTSLSLSTNHWTGQITTNLNSVPHGFLYENGAMVDLNSLISTNSGWVIQHAYSINDSDQILCEGQSASGSFHSFILQVPEPSVSSLLIFGSAGIILYRRKRRKLLRAEIPVL
jgi:probable HAF family extracellular repeat protein